MLYIQNKVFFLIIIYVNFILLIFYGSTMIFNYLYEINISLVGIIHQIMSLIYQINLNLVNVGTKYETSGP